MPVTPMFSLLAPALALVAPDPLPSVADEPAGTPSAAEPPAAKPDKPADPAGSPLDPPVKAGGDDPSPGTVADDPRGVPPESAPVPPTPSRGEPPPEDDGKVGPVEYRYKHLQPPSQEAIGRQADPAAQAGPAKKEKWVRPGSPQRFAFEVKFGPYIPDVDRNHTGDGFGPYSSIFGETNSMGEAIDDPRKGLFSAGAFEWQFYYLAGSFLLGTQVGFFRDKAQAIVADPPEDADSIRSTADEVTFSVLPVSFLLGYRFSMLADRWNVPIVPYFKGGLAYGFWWSRDGSRNISRNPDGEKGRGGSWGWQINPGVMIRLDWIDRAAAKAMDNQAGVNHVSLFAEWQLTRLDNFGSDRAMSVGDSTYLIGLAIEF